jgi:hypothetical protein
MKNLGSYDPALGCPRRGLDHTFYERVTKVPKVEESAFSAIYSYH